LLIETDWPLKAVAARLGYSDTFFFAAQFKALAGMPPAAFRKSRM
jgi:AraC-like DNA-binding protein